MSLPQSQPLSLPPQAGDTTTLPLPPLAIPEASPSAALNPAQSPAYHITVPNHFDALTDLSQWLEALAPRLGLSQRGLFRLQMTTEEAVTNIIQNAYTDDREHQIQVSLHPCDRGLTLSICDDGLSFNPLHYPEAQPPKTLELAQEGGMGIQLIRHFSDACFYHRAADRNVLQLVIYDTPQGGTS